MIKINLALRKTASLEPNQTKSGIAGFFSRGGGGGGGTGITTLSELREIPQLRTLAILVIAIGAAYYFFDDYKEGELRKVDQVIAAKTGENAKLKAELEQGKQYEEIRKELEADEQTIKNKLEVIQKLVQDREMPSKILIALSAAIPKDVWLGELKTSVDELAIAGDSEDFNQVTDFMKNLNENAYFKDASLKTTQKTKDEFGVEVAHFELTVKRR